MLQVDGRGSLHFFTHFIIHHFGQFGWELWKRGGGDPAFCVLDQVFIKIALSPLEVTS